MTDHPLDIHTTDTYFPPPQAEGGWRSLVPANEEPSREQKEAVRATAGLDWDKLSEVWGYCQGFEGPHSVLVIRHGWIAGEWHNYSEPRGIASCTKSLTGLAMAKLFDLSDIGLLPKPITIDDEAWRYLPASWAEAEPSRKQIKLRHLLTMTSGLDPYDGPFQGDYLEVILSRQVEAAPGTLWAYSSSAVDLLTLVIESVTGKTLGEFFNAQTDAAIGATPSEWGYFGKHANGSGKTSWTPRELARVGYMVLHDGAWRAGGDVTQVISAERVLQFTRAAPWLESARMREPNFAFEPNANRYYGHLWWTNLSGQGLGNAAPRDAVYMSGWGKQACFVVPSLDMVAIRLGPLGGLNQQPEFYHRFWERLMPAVVG